MEQLNLIGPFRGSQPREILMPAAGLSETLSIIDESVKMTRNGVPSS
jgi:hypothetical protein